MSCPTAGAAVWALIGLWLVADAGARAGEEADVPYSREFGGRVVRAIGGCDQRLGEAQPKLDQLQKEGDVESVLLDVIRWGLEKRPLNVDVDNGVYSTAPMDAGRTLGQLGSRCLLAEAVEFFQTAEYPGPMPDEKTVSGRDPRMVRWRQFDERYTVYLNYVSNCPFHEGWDVLRSAMLRYVALNPGIAADILTCMRWALKMGPTDQLDEWIRAVETIRQMPGLDELSHRINPSPWLSPTEFSDGMRSELELLHKWRNERKDHPPPTNGSEPPNSGRPQTPGVPGSGDFPGDGSAMPNRGVKPVEPPDSNLREWTASQILLFALALAVAAGVVWFGFRALRRPDSPR